MVAANAVTDKDETQKDWHQPLASALMQTGH